MKRRRSGTQNAKPLSQTLTRALVLTARNLTDLDKVFRMTIADQPADGKASWLKNPQAGDPDPLVVLDVEIGARSGIARSVFATSSNPREHPSSSS